MKNAVAAILTVLIVLVCGFWWTAWIPAAVVAIAWGGTMAKLVAFGGFMFTVGTGAGYLVARPNPRKQSDIATILFPGRN